MLTVVLIAALSPSPSVARPNVWSPPTEVTIAYRNAGSRKAHNAWDRLLLGDAPVELVAKALK